MGATNTKDDARNTGTERRVIHWNSSVPRPAVNRATLGSSPVSNGISTMAPKATNSICAPIRIIFQFQNPGCCMPVTPALDRVLNMAPTSGRWSLVKMATAALAGTENLVSGVAQAWHDIAILVEPLIH